MELVLESSIDNVLIANLTQLAGQTTEFNAKSRDVAGGEVTTGTKNNTAHGDCTPWN